MPKQKWSQHRPLFSKPAAPQGTEDKRRWVILPVVWAAAKRMAMVLGFMVLLSSLLSFTILSTALKDTSPDIPREGALYIEFEDGLFDQTPGALASLADPFAPPPVTLREMVNAIEAAKSDARIKGIFARLSDGAFSSAEARELRDALIDFKGSGKFLKLYASSYGGVAGGLSSYYLASVFDEIWMQPMGIVSIPGIRVEAPYFRMVLDKIGIQPQFFQRKDYKTAYEAIQLSAMSEENREMLSALLDDVQGEVLGGIAQSRSMSVQEFSALQDYGLFTSEEAEKVGLITHRDYADVLLDEIEKDVVGAVDTEEEFLIALPDYIAMQAQKKSGFPMAVVGDPKVAVIYASGAIMSDSGDGASGIAAADVIAPAIFEATDDEDVEAIVLRVNSPGGSPVASETILRALDKAQDKGKLVVVSMGAVAASGGYWIASHADQIFAQPTTITGSIGVVGGKFSAEELWENIGVNWDMSIQRGANAGLWSLNTPFSESEAERFNTMLDYTYISFLERVAKGRNMSMGEVDKIAGGRVWSGKRAQEIGLVDQLGGLNDALDYVAQRLELKGRDELSVQIYPAPKTPIEQFVAVLSGEVSVRELPGVSGFVAFLNALQAVMVQISMVTQPQDYTLHSEVKIR